MAGRDSAFLTERIRAASDIVDVVGAFVTLRRAGRSFIGLCPFHKEKSASFHVNPERQTFHCFGCKAGGDVFKFIQLRDGVDFLESREILARRANIDTTADRAGASSAGAGKNDLERVNQWAARWFRSQYESPAGAACRAYVASRGVTDDTASAFRLGFAPAGWSSLCDAARRAGISSTQLQAAGLAKPRESDGGLYDVFRNRLIFPIQDALSRVIGFGGRTLDDDRAKYLNSPQTILFDKSRALYGLLQSRESWKVSHRAVVTEGYLDCILCHQAGFQDVVATLGTAMTAEHIGIFSRYRIDSAVLVFDADEAGQKAADRAISLILPQKLDVRIAQVPKGMDPADVIVRQGKEAFGEFLTRAAPALEFKWEQVVRRWHGAAGDGDRRRAVEEFLGVVAAALNERSIDAIQRGFILNQVGKLLGLASDQVDRQLRIMATRSRSSPTPQPGQGTNRAQPAPVADARQAALREILTVLLNAPDRYSAVDAVFDPSAMADPVDRRIAEAAIEMMESAAGFTMTGLIGRFNETSVSSRIMELAWCGQQRENFDSIIEGAVTRLQALAAREALAASISALRQAPRSDADNTTADEVAEVVEAARRHSQFVARRHLAALNPSGAAPRGPASGDA